MKMNERAYLGVLIHLRRLFHCCCCFSWNRYQLASNYPHLAHFPFMTDKSNDFCDLFDIQVQHNRLVLLLVPLHSNICLSFARSSVVHNLKCFANAKVCGGVCFAIEKQAARINPVENFSLAKIVCAVWPMLMRMRSLLNMRQFKSVSFESHNKFAKPNHTNPKANSK